MFCLHVSDQFKNFPTTLKCPRSTARNDIKSRKDNAIILNANGKKHNFMFITISIENPCLQFIIEKYQTLFFSTIMCGKGITLYKY